MTPRPGSARSDTGRASSGARRVGRRGGLRLLSLVGAAVLATALLAACSPAPAPAPPAPPAPPAVASPSGFYVDPQSPAAQQVTRWKAEGRDADAADMATVAAQPMPLWLTADTGSVGRQVSSYVGRAAAVGQRPLLVAYHIPNRDCGSFSSGGARDDADYRQWVREIATALGGHAATVILEPDAVPHEVSGCVRSSEVEQRYALLADAVQVLKAAGEVKVYLDAGNPGFITDVDALAGALRSSGVDGADGFSLNVANFWTTDENVEFGLRVSERLGGKHFVIDTSRNGNGHVGSETIDGGPSFCNPPGRALGQVPTLTTGTPQVDAYLWIKRVGESDGACRPDEPAAGEWWPEYALELARNAG